MLLRPARMNKRSTETFPTTCAAAAAYQILDVTLVIVRVYQCFFGVLLLVSGVGNHFFFFTIEKKRMPEIFQDFWVLATGALH